MSTFHTLPELLGGVGHLGWALGGLRAVHRRLLETVGDGRAFEQTIAGLMHAASLDIENNLLYIWPYFAETPLDQLTPPQEVELLRLVPPGLARDMKAKGRYSYWRVSIGADGSWHSFKKDE